MSLNNIILAFIHILGQQIKFIDTIKLWKQILKLELFDHKFNFIYFRPSFGFPITEGNQNYTSKYIK